MTDADRPTFGVEMALLAEVFGEQLSETRLEIYFADLRHFDLEHVRMGIRLARATRKFFPRIADIAECVDEAVEARVQAHAAASRQLVAPGTARLSAMQSAGQLVSWVPRQ